MRGSRRSGGSAKTNMAKRPQIKSCPICGRPYVEMGRKMCREGYEKEEKMELINVLNREVIINNRKEYVSNAVKIYTKSVFDAINEENPELIKFVEI